MKRFLSCVAALALAVALSTPVAADVFYFSTGDPDGLMAVAARPDSYGQEEIEAADDFILPSRTLITGASLIGLLPYGATVDDIDEVKIEIYRVFPLDSDLDRVPEVPTRVNSPSDVEFDDRTTADGNLLYIATILKPQFQAANSVVNGIFKAPDQTTDGEGPVAGQLVRFDMLFDEPFDLPADHYFFVPQVKLKVDGNFLWLSAPFTGAQGDLQMWIRNADLQPDWLRVATDIVGGDPKFNGSFSLWGETVDD